VIRDQLTDGTRVTLSFIAELNREGKKREEPRGGAKESNV
jgi:hypothetical protein